MRCRYCNTVLANNDVAMEHAGICPIMNAGNNPDSDMPDVAEHCDQTDTADFAAIQRDLDAVNYRLAIEEDATPPAGDADR